MARRHSPHHPERLGLTLVELIVVVAVLGILISLTVPAVQIARESSRRAQCANNLRQIGLALHSYAITHDSFPAGRAVMFDARHSVPGLSCTPLIDRSFLVRLLPQLDHAPLYNQLNHGLSILMPEQSTFYRFSIGMFACPSDSVVSGGRTANVNARLPTAAPSMLSVRLTNYAGFYGSDGGNALPDPRHGCRPRPGSEAEADGCINDLSPLPLAAVTDGLSTTMVAAERCFAPVAITSPSADTPHGWWFSGEFADTVITAYDGPNLFRRLSPLAPISVETLLSSASSFHPGGLNVLMGDGSVRFIMESIHARPYLPGSRPSTSGGVWSALSTRSGGESISEDEF